MNGRWGADRGDGQHDHRRPARLRGQRHPEPGAGLHDRGGLQRVDLSAGGVHHQEGPRRGATTLGGHLRRQLQERRHPGVQLLRHLHQVLGNPRQEEDRVGSATATAMGPSPTPTAWRWEPTPISTGASPVRRSTWPIPTTTASRSSRPPAPGSPRWARPEPTPWPVPSPSSAGWRWTPRGLWGADLWGDRVEEFTRYAGGVRIHLRRDHPQPGRSAGIPARRCTTRYGASPSTARVTWSPWTPSTSGWW